MAVHHPLVPEKVVAPQLGQQNFPGKHPPGAGQELPQQLELPGGELLQHPAVQAYLHRVGVQGQPPVAQAASGRVATRPPQHRRQLPQQDGHGEGLGDVVVDLQIKAPELLSLSVQGGEQDNGHPGLAADKLAHPKAVQLGQHHVQQDQVERLLLKEAHRLNAVPRRCRLIARVAQVGLQQLLDVLLVLHNQNAFHCESLPKQMVAHNCEFCMEKVSRAAARKYRCPPFLLRGMIRPLPAFQA